MAANSEERQDDIKKLLQKTWELLDMHDVLSAGTGRTIEIITGIDCQTTARGKDNADMERHPH